VYSAFWDVEALTELKKINFFFVFPYSETSRMSWSPQHGMEMGTIQGLLKLIGRSLWIYEMILPPLFFQKKQTTESLQPVCSTTTTKTCYIICCYFIGKIKFILHFSEIIHYRQS